MTDKARELLERALEVFCSSLYGEFELKDEIRAYLADTKSSETINSQEVDRSEPVGILRHNGQFELQRMVGIPIGQPMKLYEHPAPRPDFVRLSEEEVNSLTYAPYEPYELICAVENRLVEKNNG